MIGQATGYIWLAKRHLESNRLILLGSLPILGVHLCREWAKSLGSYCHHVLQLVPWRMKAPHLDEHPGILLVYSIWLSKCLLHCSSVHHSIECSSLPQA